MVRVYVHMLFPCLGKRTWRGLVSDRPPVGIHALLQTCTSTWVSIALLQHDLVPFMADGDAMSFLMRIFGVKARMSFCSGLGEKMVEG